VLDVVIAELAVQLKLVSKAGVIKGEVSIVHEKCLFTDGSFFNFEQGALHVIIRALEQFESLNQVLDYFIVAIGALTNFFRVTELRSVGVQESTEVTPAVLVENQRVRFEGQRNLLLFQRVVEDPLGNFDFEQVSEDGKDFEFALVGGSQKQFKQCLQVVGIRDPVKHL